MAADGTVCSANHVCSNGACTYCVEGELCQTGGPCYYDSLSSCSHGVYCFNLRGNFPDGSTCVDGGTVGHCESAQCLP